MHAVVIKSKVLVESPTIGCRHCGPNTRILHEDVHICSYCDGPICNDCITVSATVSGEVVILPTVLHTCSLRALMN
jgi:hypothetical protein